MQNFAEIIQLMYYFLNIFEHIYHITFLHTFISILYCHAHIFQNIIFKNLKNYLSIPILRTLFKKQKIVFCTINNQNCETNSLLILTLDQLLQ